jgi:hypothetical protein|tara:strand:+ start:1229 stop:1564 length:336 start_codon:yes stop_codon:yes gene_type:complete
LRLLLSALLCGSVLSGPAHALTYEGEEAAALRCANMIAYTAVTLARADMIGEDEKTIMLGVTVLILERHVSGTRAQKKSAMGKMRDRRSIDQTLEDYRKHAAQCLVQFPIN